MKDILDFCVLNDWSEEFFAYIKELNKFWANYTWLDRKHHYWVINNNASVRLASWWNKVSAKDWIKILTWKTFYFDL